MASNTQVRESAADQEPLQLLTFLLDREVYGTDISQIQEVLEYRKVTPVPRTPDFMLGVINLRGNVVPVVDLRRQFGMHVSATNVDTCIIIVDVLVDGEKTAMGILADAVKEVISLGPGEVSPPPRIGSRIDTRFISGMGKHDEEFIVILNLPRVFSQNEFEEMIDSIQYTGAPGVNAELQSSNDDQ
ncbi:MAG: chemotaxis protein CheW [Chromatiaceae bacterium]|nr:chemotaxis protein CheW [Gammaproteobacteria bacterium]MCB1862630.1 chemotaxis protein CheW [Gammaproteobacteria bacterium]MCB1871135.1 chemotaxis protein CheW [Gammaproteobacteria bacterium]MCB1880578.1 chemotaxis protein CheW [Gammaproteobacteria bacterium]MCP5448553.1 chemotaxis protein CheW [Chromatiaceae bacterium]